MSSKTVLRPRITDLQSGDPKLQDLHRYALHLLQGQDPTRTAHNASLLFLTVVNAFQHAGITDLDWVPSLYIEVASREYEIQVHGAHDGESYSADLPTSLMSVEGSAFNRNSDTPIATASLRPIRPTGRAHEATSRCSSSDLGGFGMNSTSESGQKDYRSSTEQVSFAVPQQLSKAMVSLLASLSARDLSTGLSSQTAGLPLASVTAEGQSLIRDVAAINGPPRQIGQANAPDRDEVIRHIELCDRQLDALDRNARSLSVKTNWTYWHLGKAYEAFCIAHRVEQEPDWQSRVQQQRLFTLLCERPAFVASASPGPARFALQKRLQRARKFLSLVDVFGPFVLNVVPEISVSRLDTVKLDDLYKLDSNGLNKEVTSIVRKLELAEAMQATKKEDSIF